MKEGPNKILKMEEITKVRNDVKEQAATVVALKERRAAVEESILPEHKAEADDALKKEPFKAMAGRHNAASKRADSGRRVGGGVDEPQPKELSLGKRMYEEDSMEALIKKKKTLVNGGQQWREAESKIKRLKEKLRLKRTQEAAVMMEMIPVERKAYLASLTDVERSAALYALSPAERSASLASMGDEARGTYVASLSSEEVLSPQA